MTISVTLQSYAERLQDWSAGGQIRSASAAILPGGGNQLPGAEGGRVGRALRQNVLSRGGRRHGARGRRRGF